ncbi:hypothetical protein [Empedobacter brevis]|uniref:hypothetical protein n=1 Tax=Empedobacter brevis TaxID=247 RepID=UPI0028AC1D10|nr:hypothetical protein [Empedobacter brevis]
MKLTSSKNFGKTLKDKTDSEYRRLRDNFDNFLEHALHLGMFVPTDEEGNVLEEPEKLKKRLKIFHPNHSVPYNGINTTLGYYITEYQQAKERVLFEGFYVDIDTLCHSDYWLCITSLLKEYDIEDLINILCADEVILTEAAKKQIGL